MKSTFLLAQIVAVIITAILLGIATYKSQDRDSLIVHVKIIAVISIIFLLTTIMAKLYIDKEYTEEKFGDFYEQYEKKEETSDKQSKITVGLSGIKLSNEKETYIEKSKGAYANFTTKSIIYMVAHGIFIIFLFYLAHRLTIIDKGKDQLEKDDAILFDEDNVFK